MTEQVKGTSVVVMDCEDIKLAEKSADEIIVQLTRPGNLTPDQIRGQVLGHIAHCMMEARMRGRTEAEKEKAVE